MAKHKKTKAPHQRRTKQEDQGIDPGRVFLFCALAIVTGVTALTFAGVIYFDFVNWDDDYVLVKNPHYLGFTWKNIQWMFTTGHAGHYQPLTWLSYALDYVLSGHDEPQPAAFHVTNLLLHMATATAFFYLCLRILTIVEDGRRSQGVVIGACMAALIFAIHPLRAESVAWATERRDVLSGFFLMVTLVLYLRATTTPDRNGRTFYLAVAIASFVLSLMSKAVGITLPIVLLVLDWYPLRRFRSDAGNSTQTSIRSVLVEKLLFLAPAIAVGLLALWAQADAGAMRSSDEHTLGLRIGQSFYGMAFYLWKTIWPTGLIPLYEQDWQATGLEAANIASGILAITLTIGFWVLRKRTSAPLVCWAIYLIVLSPMLGIAQSGPQVVADRYSYLSCMPWAVLLGAGVSWLWSRESINKRRTRMILALSCTLLVTVLANMGRKQTLIWANSTTLWTTTIDRAPQTGTAYANLASEMNRHKNYKRARELARTALGILPGNRVAHIALARSSTGLGDYTTAEKQYEIALAIRPDDLGVLVSLAGAKLELGKHKEAEAYARRLIQLEPQAAIWQDVLARILARIGRNAEARAAFEKSLQLDPTHLEARFRLSDLLRYSGQPENAIRTLEDGLKLMPGNPTIAAKLAKLLASTRVDELRDGDRALKLARSAFRYAESIQPLAHEALAAALAETGDFDGAAATINSLLTNTQSRLPQTTKARLARQRQRYLQHEPLRN